MTRDDKTRAAAVLDALDAIDATMAPHGTLAEALATSGYPQSQVEGARLADFVSAFNGLTAALRLMLPTRDADAPGAD